MSNWQKILRVVNSFSFIIYLIHKIYMYITKKKDKKFEGNCCKDSIGLHDTKLGRLYVIFKFYFFVCLYKINNIVL